MNNSVCIFTNEFPFGLQETFIENELPILCSNFEEVIIIPLFKHKSIRTFPYKNLKIMTPVNNSRKITIHKLVLLLYPTFWKTLSAGISELGVGKNKILKIIKQAFIVARLEKYISKRSEVTSFGLWYFYWGTNAISILPFLNIHPRSIARFHGYDLYSSDCREGQVQVFQKKIVQKLSVAFFVSNDGLDYFKKKYSTIKNVRLQISKLGVPDRGINPFKESPFYQIVTCSNIYEVKNVHLLAKALSRIKSTNIKWTHFGDGPRLYKGKLFREIDKLGENIEFDFKGRKSNLEVMDFYKKNSVDLFVNTSISEGLPVSIMEALSFGIPVMLTSVGGATELITNNVNGIILEERVSSSHLAKEITQFFDSDNKQMRVEARKSWERNVSAEINYNDFVKEIQIV